MASAREQKKGKEQRRNLPLLPDCRRRSDRACARTSSRESFVITQQATFGLTHKRHGHFGTFLAASHLTVKGDKTWVRPNKSKMKTSALGIFSKKPRKLRVCPNPFFFFFFFGEINSRKTAKDSCHGYWFSAKGRTLFFFLT